MFSGIGDDAQLDGCRRKVCARWGPLILLKCARRKASVRAVPLWIGRQGWFHGVEGFHQMNGGIITVPPTVFERRP